MSNDIVNSNKNLPVQYESNIEELAAAASNDLGTILKFTKGLWTLGENKAPADAEFIACPEAVVIGWVRFDDKKVVERVLKHNDDRRRLPDRDELSMPDKSQWPLDNKGAPKDPWAKQYYLPMLDANGALVTFITPSIGGKIAIGRLCDAFKKNKNARPIVQLAAGSFRSREFGNVLAPAFTIIGFENVATEEAPPPNCDGAPDFDPDDDMPPY